MTAYYNEIDPYAAQWLRNLITAGHIAHGDVDERSIIDVKPDELKGYTQCHFFAGIGVWSYALRQAGWDDNRPIWTGSCPCQPFSSAGRGDGFTDERHLWPHWFHLITQCRPCKVVGEQVASKDGLGWLDLVQADLEGAGYPNAAVDFCAAGVGAPHIRQRLWFVGNSCCQGLAEQQRERRTPSEKGVSFKRQTTQRASSPVSGMGDTDCQSARRHTRAAYSTQTGHGSKNSNSDRSGDARSVLSNRMADTDRAGPQQGRQAPTSSRPRHPAITNGSDSGTSSTNGFWRNVDWLNCRDGKWRPVEPGTFPLANGVTPRMVFSCASCETKVILNHELCYVQKINDRNERREPSEVLHAILHGGGLCGGNSERRQEAGSISDKENGRMQSMQVCGESTAAPQGWRHEEQRLVESGNPMSEVSLGASYVDASSNVHSLLERVFSTSQEKQNLFCPVCEEVGPHKCEKEMARRIGMLKAYGNAINAEAATQFIRSIM